MFVGDDERLLSFLNIMIEKGPVYNDKVWELLLECQIRREAQIFQSRLQYPSSQISEVIRLLDHPKVKKHGSLYLLIVRGGGSWDDLPFLSIDSL
jgi:hypothetical protein